MLEMKIIALTSIFFFLTDFIPNKRRDACDGSQANGKQSETH